jgi:histidinol-phosphate aminotransferase
MAGGRTARNGSTSGRAAAAASQSTGKSPNAEAMGARHNESAMTVTFAQKLAQIPHYEPGTSLDEARARAETPDAIKLASNESPYPPHPKVVEAIAAAAAEVNRYPDPAATVLRRRIAERHDTEPGRIAVGNGSCEILLAAAAALCEQGAELIFAWPAFSIYPYLAPLSGAREVRVGLDAEERHELDAIAAEITAATQLAIVCNPNNPTATYVGAERVRAFLERVPSHVTVILDEAYIEYQVTDDPDTTADLLSAFPNLVLLRTFSKCYGLAGIRVGYALCSPQFRAAVDAVRQPFSVNAIAQAAAAEAILHQDDVANRVEKTLVERVFIEEGLRELGISTAESESNFAWLDLGERDEAEVTESLARAGVAVRPGTPLGGPGHLRVTYGTRSENERFLSALADAI